MLLVVSTLWFQAENIGTVLPVQPSLAGQHPHMLYSRYQPVPPAVNQQCDPREQRLCPLVLQTKHDRNLHANVKGHCSNTNQPALHRGRQDFITVCLASLKPLPILGGLREEGCDKGFSCP